MSEIKEGDIVEHIHGVFEGTQTVREVKKDVFDVEYAFFVDGGYWRVDRLRKVNK